MKKEKINTDKLREEIEYLSEFMLPERYAAIQKVVADRTEYVTVCLENIFHPQNASAVIRSCEAFGLQNIHVIEEKCHFSPNINIVKGSDKWLNINRYNMNDASRELVNKLKNDGYRIVATSPHISGSSVEDFDITKGKCAIFLGTEKQGVSDTVLAAADDFIRVDMYGFVESLNVSVCGAIIINNLVSRLHKQIEIDWQLSSYEQLVLLNEWMKKSVKDSERILKGWELEKLKRN